MKRPRRALKAPVIWEPWVSPRKYQSSTTGHVYGVPLGWSLKMNNEYIVFIERRALTREEPAQEIQHLVIRRRDNRPVRAWRDLQRIKDELCGVEAEAVELFPAESRKLDVSNEAHLFVFPEGTVVPLGSLMRQVLHRWEAVRLGEATDDPHLLDGAQEPFTDDPYGPDYRPET